MTTYDAWKTTPPDDTENEYAEEDALEQEHQEHMQAFQSWLNNADELQLNAAERLLTAERDRRRRTYAEKLRALGDSEVKVPRVKRKDAGKPRTPKAESEVLP